MKIEDLKKDSIYQFKWEERNVDYILQYEDSPISGLPVFKVLSCNEDSTWSKCSIMLLNKHMKNLTWLSD